MFLVDKVTGGSSLYCYIYAREDWSGCWSGPWLQLLQAAPLWTLSGDPHFKGKANRGQDRGKKEERSVIDVVDNELGDTGRSSYLYILQNNHMLSTYAKGISNPRMMRKGVSIRG